MDNIHIVIIVLLVLLVVGFLAIIVAIAIAAAKAAKIIAPIRSVVTAIKKVRQIGPKLKGKAGQLSREAKQIAIEAKQVAKKVAGNVRSDLRQLQLQMKSKSAKTNIQQLLARGLAILSGDPCAKFEVLWASHINLTFYYGMLALASLDDISPSKQAKMDWAVSELLQIQKDLAQLMSPCVVTPSELENLLRFHIIIVAQIANKWRDDGGTQPFDPRLVGSWYRNASETVQLLEMKTIGPNEALSQAYTQHLDETAAYLTAISQIHGSGELVLPNKNVLEKFAVALSHVPMLTAAFCYQMQVCKGK